MRIESNSVIYFFFFLNKYSMIYMNCSYVVLIQFCDFASVCGVIDEDHSGGLMG